MQFAMITLCKNVSTLCTQKVISDSPGLVDFAVGLVNSFLTLPSWQVNCCLGLGNSNYSYCKTNFKSLKLLFKLILNKGK